MFLLVLDKNPVKSARLIPNKIKFKQLLELSQLICSAGISDVFKPINQGKELQQWVSKNKEWINLFMFELLNWAKENINMKPETDLKLTKIFNDLDRQTKITGCTPKSAIFRYAKEYVCDTPSKTELPIEQAVLEYQKYKKYKSVKWGV